VQRSTNDHPLLAPRDDLAGLLCVRDPHLRVLTFDFDVTELMAVRTTDDLRTPRHHVESTWSLSAPERRGAGAIR